MTKARAHHEEEGGGMERWLLTYSDMITLLLALFVILFAMSTINAQKFRAFKLGLTKTFSDRPIDTSSSGLLPHQNSLLNKPVTLAMAGESSSSATSPSQSMQQIAKSLDTALSAAGLAQYATTTVSAQGVVVQMLADKAYFETDSATLGTVGDEVVDTIGGVLRSVPNQVEVEGYTDNTPITGGPFTSNWELSAVRAVDVVLRLERVDKVASARLRAVGFGDTHPIASNATAAGRAQNRRVDVVVLTTTLTTPAPPGASS